MTSGGLPPSRRTLTSVSNWSVPSQTILTPVQSSSGCVGVDEVGIALVGLAVADRREDVDFLAGVLLLALDRAVERGCRHRPRCAAGAGRWPRCRRWWRRGGGPSAAAARTTSRRRCRTRRSADAGDTKCAESASACLHEVSPSGTMHVGDVMEMLWKFLRSSRRNHSMRFAEGKELCKTSRRTSEGAPVATITLNDIDKVYDNGFQAVTGLSLDIDDGEFLVLVGPSGCGKSTALRMIAGLESISGGELRIGDRGGQRPRAEGPRHRHGVPVVRAVPAPDRARQHRLRPEAAEGAEGRDRTSASPTRRASSSSPRTSIAARRSCRAASASVWRWAGPSCASRRRS